jgi:hypothetical protein
LSRSPAGLRPATHRLVGQDAHNVIVGNGERGEDAAAVDRYAEAVANREPHCGHLSAATSQEHHDGESVAADLIADSMLAAACAPENGGAQLWSTGRRSRGLRW